MSINIQKKSNPDYVYPKNLLTLSKFIHHIILTMSNFVQIITIGYLNIVKNWCTKITNFTI
jgi:hypothetical protein